MGLQFKTICPIDSGMPVTTFKDVVALWGSPDALAADIGASVAAARKWPQRDNIPAEWWLPILETDVARKAGLTAEMLASLAARPAAEPAQARA